MNENELRETGESLVKKGILTTTTNDDGETVYDFQDHVEMFGHMVFIDENGDLSFLDLETGDFTKTKVGQDNEWNN